MDNSLHKDSVPAMYRTQNEAFQKDQHTFWEKLKEFPHLFQLQGYTALTKERRQDILDRLHLDIADCDSYRTPVEETCMKNFVAFLLFLKKDVSNALKETRKVLESPNTDTNIVALANMAVMQWETGRREEGEKFVKKLQELRDQENFEDKVLDGKAEMAYCYSRMGMSFALLAVGIFEKVVQQRPHDYTWKSGLALVLRRLTHINFRMYYRMSSEETSQRSLRAFDLLLEIKNSGAPDGQKAQALAELGMLVAQVWNNELSEVMDRAKERDVTAEQCYEESLKLAPNDVNVLTKAGKFFQNNNNLDRSRELLKHAITIRPTTIAHHYLALTFVKMARLEQIRQSRQSSKYQSRGRIGNRRTRRQRGGNRHAGKRGVYYREEESRKVEYSTETSFVENRPLSGSLSENLATNVSAMKRNKNYDQTGSCQLPPAPESVKYKKILKSPAKTIKLKPDGKHVSDALSHFQQAIEVSHMENSPAIYDLGLLYVSIGDDDKAFELFGTLFNQKESLNPLQVINAYEQAGLIYMRKSNKACDDDDRKSYAANGRRLLQEALQLQCQFVSSLPTCVPDYKDLWPSFYTLCRPVRGTEAPDQLRELARLYEMVKDYTECLNVLDEMSKISSEEAHSSPEFLERKLKCYINLNQYDDALLFLSLLETTEQAAQISTWSDPELPRKVRIMAAKQKLLNVADETSGSTEEKAAKACFLQAVQARSYHSYEETQRKSVNDGRSEDQDRKWWHVMILHDLQDDDMKVKGLALKSMLQNVCGLRVTCMSDEEDIKPGQTEMWTILENVEKSQTVVVLCGLKDLSDEFCDIFLQPLPEIRARGDSACHAILVLLLDNAERPKKFKYFDRCLQCPPTLIKPTQSYSRPELIHDLCNLFCFLAEVSIDFK